MGERTGDKSRGATPRLGEVGDEPRARGGDEPRGYRRPDEAIKADVRAALDAHDELDARDVRCTVTRGEVILAGTVSSRWARNEVERIAELVRGVVDVHNELQVKPLLS